jgi:hypothetical protein
MMRWLLFAVAASAIAGCVTTQSYDQLVGQGRIDLAKQTWVGYEQ